DVPFRRDARGRAARAYGRLGARRRARDVPGCRLKEIDMHTHPTTTERSVRIPAGQITLDGDLAVPESTRGVVLFAHGSGSSRFSPRNRYVADVLHRVGLATLLMDLLTPDEEQVDAVTAHFRFDIG